MHRTSSLLSLVLLASLGSDAAGQESADALPKGVAPVEALEREGVAPLSRVGNVLLAGQPSAETLEAFAAEGTTIVIDLRMPVEQRGFDEPALVKGMGLTYVLLGFGGPQPMTDEILGKARGMLAEHRADGEGDLLLHCASAFRVGAVWLSGRVLDEGVPWDTAVVEARGAGLRSPGLESAVESYVLGGGNTELGKLVLDLREELPGVPRIGIAALGQRLESEKPLVLLDVRAPEEFAVSQIKGAQRAETLEEALDLLAGKPKDAEVVVYCSVGYRSGELALALGDEGYSKVRNLEGSIFAWANSGRPVYHGRQLAHHVHPYDEEWGTYLLEPLRADLDK